MLTLGLFLAPELLEIRASNNSMKQIVFEATQEDMVDIFKKSKVKIIDISCNDL